MEYHCPQFVDFTTAEAFDNNDGADLFFEKGVVGEFGSKMETDLGMFGTTDLGMFETDPVKEITVQMTNLNKSTPPQPESMKKPLQTSQENKQARPMTRKSLKDAQEASKQTHTNDKENTPIKKPIKKEVASSKLDSEVSSAIDMIQGSRSKTPKRPDSGTPTRPDSLNSLSTPVIDKTDDNDTPQPPMANSNGTPEPPKISIKPPSPDLSKPTAASLSRQKQAVINATTNPSIVKKTLAKMTAAFKPNRPVVVDRDVLAAKSKQRIVAKTKPIAVNTAVPRISRANTENNANDFRKRSGSRTNESRLARPISPEASSSRRCSSVPKTLRERQALNNSRLVEPKATKGTLGEKIQNFFNSGNKTKVNQKSSAQLKTSTSKGPIDPTNRRRSRSVNEKINRSKVSNSSTPSKPTVLIRRPSISQNDSMNTTKSTKSSYTKITASPSFSKPIRPKSPNLPQGVTSFYTGVKFVGSNHSQLNIKKKLINTDAALPSFNSGNNLLTSNLGPLPVSDLLKNRPMCLQKKTATLGAKNTSVIKKPVIHITRTTPGKSASFRGPPSTNTSLLTKPHVKSNVSDHGLNVSVDKTGLNVSGIPRLRKASASSNNCSINAGAASGLLRTEVRAMKRSEYEKDLKDKEKMAFEVKQLLDKEKERKQKEEIQKIRNQRNFRSKPIKHYTGLTPKPSEKSLTAPKSPQLSTSTLRLNDLSRNETANYNSSHRLSMALVDAPLVKKKAIVKCNHSLFAQQETVRMTTRTRTVSSNDM